MGLLDNIDGDTILSGLLSAGAASGAKGPYLARVAAGLAQGERFKQGRAEQARQRSQDEMQAEYRDLVKKKMQMDMAQQERAGLLESQKAAEAQRIEGLIRNAGQVRGGMGAGLPAGTLPDDLSMPAQPALQQQGQINAQSLVQQGVPFERVKQLMEAPNLGRAEVARTIKGMSGGREVEQQYDKFGNPVGQGMEQFKAPIMLDRGGQTDAISPYTQPGVSFPKTMTFGDKNAAASLALSRERLNFDKAGGADAGKPQLVDGQFVYKPTAEFPQGRTVPAAGFQKSMGEGQKKQLSGIESLNGAIGEYVSQLDKWGKFSVLSPTARAEMGTKYNNMMLQAKEAYNLGVLNGPDLEILTAVVTDPRSYTGVITSKEALKNQATELSRIMSKVTAPAVRDGGASAEAGMPSSPMKFQDPAKESRYQKWLRENQG